MKLIRQLFILAAISTLGLQSGKAAGWPANYKGVMLQGFYWDAYKAEDDTKWATLTKRADELSQYFKLIWIPNSARANGENGGGNGYMPIYWFTNHNCAYGTAAELKTMISTYKEKGVGFIEDVVVNHRVGVTRPYDFPRESWNGQTWQLTDGAICSTDEMWSEGGQGCPYKKGNPDTGEDFGGARDLDHTNTTVQNHVKNYCKFLLDDMGYVGFRLDMVKGYGGQYTKIYNQYSKPQFCVGEYFDSSYDAVAAWIEATGRESAAFDFPFKYAVNEAFSANDMTKLSWAAQYITPQPAGLIHYGYAQYAVTFVDNHDTYRDGSKFTGNVVAANAFMLCSPGTPCVFYPHYQAYKKEIQALINVRNQVGVHNMSPVTVLRLERDCYMAEVTGTNGKLVVKIGSSMAAPDGYTNAQIKCSGNGYCVWATTSGGVTPSTPDDTDYPSVLYMQGHVNGYEWSTSKGISKAGQKGVYTWEDVTIDNGENGYGFISFATKLGSDWDTVNANHRYGASSENQLLQKGQSQGVVKYVGGMDASSCKSWKIKAGTYNVRLDLGSMQVSLTEPSAVNELEADDDEAVEYYNLQGIRVENPTRGVYIRVKGRKTEKVAL